MEDDTWKVGVSSHSRSYQSALKSLPDLCIDFEEIEGDDDDKIRAEYPCPYCTEDFDLIDFCSHIEDEHPCEDRPEVCPVCASKVSINLVRHITTSHGDMLKSLQKLHMQKDYTYSALSHIKKELENDYFHSLLSGSSTVSSSRMALDPLLSFLNIASPIAKSPSIQSNNAMEANLEEKSADDEAIERDVQVPPLSDKEQMEKTKRSEFVQGLLLSTIFDDDL